MDTKKIREAVDLINRGMGILQSGSPERLRLRAEVERLQAELVRLRELEQRVSAAILELHTYDELWNEISAAHEAFMKYPT